MKLARELGVPAFQDLGEMLRIPGLRSLLKLPAVIRSGRWPCL
jgi:hypothetical protein